MNANFATFQVGQGLFYGGQINNKSCQINFVYDCGQDKANTLSQLISLKDMISNYGAFNQTNTIDFLVLSHFHEDHINGVNLLLNKFDVKNIFVPYYTNINKEILKFLISLLDLNNSSTRIIIIPPTERMETPLESDNIINFLSENNSFLEAVGELSDTNLNYKVYKFKKNTPRFRIHNWFFDMFNIEISKGEIDKINSKINSILSGYRFIDLSDFLKIASEDDFKVIRNKYLESITSYSDALNNTSICLLHCRIEALNSVQPDVQTTILTGDIDLKKRKNRKLFLNHYLYIFGKVTYFFLPHHASKSNWNVNLLKFVHSDSFFICSMGISNNHKHPSRSVLKDIVTNNYNFIIITESNIHISDQCLNLHAALNSFYNQSKAYTY